MKRYISILLIVCLMIPNIVFAQNEKYKDSTTKVLFSDNFENEALGKLPSKWKRDSSSDKKIAKVSDDPLFDGNKVFEVTSTAKSWQDGVATISQYYTNARNDISIKFRFYHLPKVGDVAPGFRFAVRNADDKIFIDFTCRNGNIKSDPAYTPGQWNELEIRTNVEEWTIDLYINGEFVKTRNMSNKSLYDAGTGFAIYCFEPYDDASWVGQNFIDDFTVTENCSSELQAIADELTFDMLSNERIEEVTENLTLPTAIGNEGQYPIEWTSENEDALTKEGVVNRRSFNQKAVLNAKITMADGLWINKQFEVNVLKHAFASDEEILSEYVDYALNFPKISSEEIDAITKNLTLPTVAPDGITVEWSSSNEDIIAIDGTVTRPNYEQEDAQVTITANVRLNEASQSVPYELTVLKEINPYVKLNEAMSEVTYQSLTTEDHEKIKKSIPLPTSHPNGTTISWVSSDDTVIDTEGIATRADVTKTVTLTAIFNYNGYEEQKEFEFTVLLNDVSMVNNDLSKIQDISDITESFYLPMYGEDYQTKYTWVSSDLTKIRIRELAEKYFIEVTRPKFEAGDASVKLTLTAVNGTETRVIEYNTTVLKENSDKDIVDAALDNLNFSDISSEDITNVTQNLALINSLDNGITIEWSSDDESVITNSGEVFNPAPSSLAKTVNFSAVFKRNYYTSDPKTFAITVAPFEDENELIDKLKSSLTFDKLSDEDIEAVSSDLTLPREWYYDSSIQWSTNSDYLNIGTDNAVVVRPEYGTGSVSAVLNAEIIWGSERITKSFEIKILEKNYLEAVEDVFFENCQSWNIGESNFTATYGTWVPPEEETFIVVDDPVNANNNVVRMGTGSNNGSGYLEYITKEASAGKFIVGMKCYVDGDNARTTVEVIGETGGGTRAVIKLNADGNIVFGSQYPVSGSEYIPLGVTYPKNEWFSLSVELDTELSKYHVYLNDQCITDYGKIYLNGEVYDSSQGVPFHYYLVPNRTTTLGGMRASQWKSSSTSDTTYVYFDDYYIKRRMTYSENQLAAATLYERELLSKNNINMLIKNLVIPEIEYAGITISASSNNTSVLANSGKISKKDENQTAEWTVSFDDGITVYKKVYTVTVAGNAVEDLTDEQSAQRDVQYAIEQLESNYLLSGLKGNVVFPIKSKYGSVLSYKSSNASAITDLGIVSRGYNDKTAEITITAVKNDAVASDKISVTILKNENNSGGGSGGSGSSNKNTISASKGVSPAILSSLSETPIQKVQTFNDVSSSYWAYDAVEYLAKNKIISGNGNGAFEPERKISREEFVKLLAQALELEYKSEPIAFSDVSLGAWYEKYIVAAVREGIINGITDTKFGIGQNVTRQDLAVMLYRAGKFLPEENYNSFGDDDKISDYAKDAVYTLRAYGIINGKTNSEFAPSEPASRAEAAMMIYRMIKNNFI